MKFHPIILISLIAGLFSASGAEPESGLPSGNLPKGPLLKRIPDFSTWQISYHYAQDKVKPGDGPGPQYGHGRDPEFQPFPPRRTTLTRTKPRWLAITEDVQGNTLEQCFDGRNHFLCESRSKNVSLALQDPTTPLLVVDYAKMDFPDMDFVTESNFRGFETIQERRCMVFARDGLMAWVDLETRLPVLWKSKGEVRVIQQLGPPLKMVELPPGARRYSEALRRDWEQLSKPVPRGG